MLKTVKVEAKHLTINSKVAIATGAPMYTRTTRGFSKKDLYIVVEVKSIKEIDKDTLGMDIVCDGYENSYMYASKDEVVEVIVPAVSPVKTGKKIIRG